MAKSTIYQVYFCQFLKIPENLVWLIFLDVIWVLLYHTFVWLNLNLLHNSQWITFPTRLCLFLYSLWANLMNLLFYDWLFRLCYHIIYIYYFVESGLFLLCHVCFLWNCFVLIPEEIQFLSYGFHSLSILTISRLRARLFVVCNVYMFFLTIFFLSSYCCPINVCVDCFVSRHCNRSSSSLLI